MSNLSVLTGGLVSSSLANVSNVRVIGGGKLIVTGRVNSLRALHLDGASSSVVGETREAQLVMASSGLLHVSELLLRRSNATFEHGSTLHAGDVHALDETLIITDGVVTLRAESFNLTAGASIAGVGRSIYPTLEDAWVDGELIWGVGHSSYNSDRSRVGPGYSSWTSHAGGSHGGFEGGWDSFLPTNADRLYGSTFYPVTCGTSGYRSKGGAALHLRVQNELVLEGGVHMDGGHPGLHRHDSTGGGAGGSVWIEARKLKGSGGNVSANGAHANYYGQSGGGGGRVAIYCDENEYTGGLPTATAYGGRGRNEWGPVPGTRRARYRRCAARRVSLAPSDAARAKRACTAQGSEARRRVRPAACSRVAGTVLRAPSTSTAAVARAAPSSRLQRRVRAARVATSTCSRACRP